MYFVTYLKTVSTAIRTPTKTKITVEWNLGKTAGFLSGPFLLQSTSTCFKPGFLREIGGKKGRISFEQNTINVFDVLEQNEKTFNLFEQSAQP